MIFRTVRDARWLHEDRIKLWSLPLIALWLYVGLLGATRGPDEVPPDFVALWAAGEMVWDGQSDLVYDWDAHAVASMAQFPGLDVRLPWIHLPPTLFLAAVFGLMPYPVAFAAWLAVSVFAFSMAAYRIAPNHAVLMGTLASGLGLWGGYLGQTGMILAAAGAGVLIFANKRPYLAGLCLAAFVVKPHLALAFPIVMIAQRRWKVLGTAIAGTLTVAAASVAVFGLDRWSDFMSSSRRMAEVMDGREAGAFEIQSLYPIARELGASAPAAATLHLGIAAIVVAGLYKAARKAQGDISPLLGAMTVTATMVLAPRIFVYDMQLLLIGVAFFASLAMKNGFLPFEKISILVLLFLPLLTTVGLPGGMLAILAFAGLIYRRAALERPRSDGSSTSASLEGAGLATRAAVLT